MVTHNGAVDDGGTNVNLPVATINQSASEALSPLIRACYAASGCPNTATYTVSMSDNSQLLSWMTFDSANARIAVAPTNGDAVGTHTIRVVMTPTHGAVETYDMLQVVITCTIASINDVAAPTTGLTYILYDKTLSIDLSGNTYTQTPDCRYITTRTASWTIPASAPIT